MTVFPDNDVPALEICDLAIGYGERTVLEHLNFTVKRGEIFGIMGGSGCGKSTLLKHIIGVYPPRAGSIRIFGRTVSRREPVSDREIASLFGVTYQGGALLGSLTLAENVALPMEEHTNWSRAKIQEKVREKLALVDLSGFETYLPSEISGGMKKRAGLARALALDPPLLFFDEPSAGLDPLTSADLDRTILKLRNEKQHTIVIVTHELDSVFTIADQVIMLDKDRKTIVDSGDPRILKDQSQVPWVRDFLNRGGLHYSDQKNTTGQADASTAAGQTVQQIG